MERYGLSTQKRGPVPPMRVSSLNSSETRTLSSAGRSSEASSMRSARSGLSFDSGHRTSQESTKPRLSKDQQEFLERQFAQHQKPNTQTKKGFANDLNVPLEKINNWFQNRRAKSKQDAKKKQNAYQHFMPPHPFATARHPADQCFIDPAFYQHAQHHPGFLQSWQPVLPGNSCEPYVNTSNAHFGVPLETSDMSQAQPLPDQLMLNDDPNPRGFDLFFGFDDFNDPNAVNMYGRQFPGPEPGNGMMDTIPEYEVPETSFNGHHQTQSNGDASSMRHNGTGPEEVSYPIPYPPGNGDLPMPPPTDFFHPNEAQNDRYAMRTWGQSAGRSLDGDPRHPALNSSMNPIDSQLPYRSIDQSHLVAGVTPSSLQYHPGRPHHPSSSMEHVGIRSPDAIESAESFDENMSNAVSPPPTKEHASRRDSTVSRLVESIDNVEVQPHLLERKASQQSIGHPSLASRRQRRPAPLSAVGGRSISFSSTTPASPKSVQPQPSERELRRVRSSIGVMNGRVQKPNFSVSSQRSPLSFTFSEAAASSKLSKSLSSRSMTSLSVDTLSRTNSLVPITPVSPPDEEVELNNGINGDKMDQTGHDPAFATDDSVWANMPNTSDTTTASIWSSHVPQSEGLDTFDDYASPPETPQQSQQGLGLRYAPQHDQYSMLPSHAQFGSAWPQSFPLAAPSHPYSVPLPPAMMGFHPSLLRHPAQEQRQTNLAGHSRHHSLAGHGNKAESTSSPKVSVAGTPAASYETANGNEAQQFTMSPQQFAPQQPQHEQKSSPSRYGSQSQPQSQQNTPTKLSSPQQQPGHQPKLSQSSGQHVFQLGEPEGIANREAPPNGSQLTMSPPRSSNPQELMIQQFSPREPVDPSRMPPRAKLNETPKQFEFQTCGPESFSSP